MTVPCTGSNVVEQVDDDLSLEFRSINTTGTSAIIEYEIIGPAELSYPQYPWDKQPYWTLSRKLSHPTPSKVYFEEDHRQTFTEDQLTVGSHTLEIELRHLKGHYAVLFCMEAPGVFDYYGATFILDSDEVLTINNPPTAITEAESGANPPQLPPVCIGCGTASVEGVLSPGPSFGDSAFPCLPREFDFSESLGLPGGMGWTGSQMPMDCGTCGAGLTLASDQLESRPAEIPFGFNIWPHLSGYQSSFGPGVMTPFDSSVHVFMYR